MFFSKNLTLKMQEKDEISFPNLALLVNLISKGSNPQQLASNLRKIADEIGKILHFFFPILPFFQIFLQILLNFFRKITPKVHDYSC